MTYDAERFDGADRQTVSGGWRAEDFVIDPWSGLAHKALVGPGKKLVPARSLAPTWVGSHQRRLNAYRVLAAYLSNVARGLLPSDRPDRQDLREYGDVAMMVDVLVAAVLGEDPEYVVEGSDSKPMPPEIAPPEPVGDDANELDRAVFEAEQQEFEDQVQRYRDAVAAHREARARQEWFDEWVDVEHFSAASLETERDTVGLGDGVMVFNWSNEAQRARVQLWDPGFYFPVVDGAGDYPKRVHIAWQQVDDEHPDRQWVYRYTWTLRRLDQMGIPPRRYAYQGDGDRPSEWGCFATAARWQYDDLGDRTVDDFDMSRAEILLNEDGEQLLDYDLGIDFVPVVHFPNTVSRKQHFGTAAVTRVAQIVDDVQNADSDLASASALTGAPPIAVGGQAAPVSGKVQTVGPGQIFYTGDGSMEALDTSKSLDALLKYKDALLDRWSTNARVPAEILGRVRASEIASGILMALSFGPFKSLVGEMRLVRAEKYALAFKMVQRLSIVGGALEGKPIRTEIRFGSYLPSDLGGVIEQVVALLGAHAVPRSTALRMLADAGVPLGDDLREELQAVEHEDFEGARELADATGSEEIAAGYLGRDLTLDVPAPGPGAPARPPAFPTPEPPPGE